MILNHRVYAKWIPAAAFIAADGDHWGCDDALVYHEVGGQIQGFCLLTTEQLDAALIGRLEIRFQNGAGNVHLFVPAAIEARTKTLLAQRPGFRCKLTVTSFYHLHLDDRKKMVVQDHVRLVNVDDSPVILKMLKQVLFSAGGIQIGDQITDPKQAGSRISTLRPDIITLDIQMPGKNGVQVVTELQRVCPLPIIMVSSLGLEEGSLVYEALNRGAFDYVHKPEFGQMDAFKSELLSKIGQALKGFKTQSQLRKTVTAPRRTSGTELDMKHLFWCIGASTGGTQALTRVLTSLPKTIPPILIVQHIPPKFSKSFAEHVNQLCPFLVKEAEDGEVIQPNTVYVAAGGFQMGVEGTADCLRLRVLDVEPVNRFKPSVDYLFQSVAKIKGTRIVAGILTGMGRDGADGLLSLKKLGARTFAQDEATSVVYGMSRAAFENGSAEEVVSIDSVSDFLMRASVGKTKAA